MMKLSSSNAFETIFYVFFLFIYVYLIEVTILFFLFFLFIYLYIFFFILSSLFIANSVLVRDNHINNPNEDYPYCFALHLLY